MNCFLPHWKSEDEHCFVEEYFFAFVYNLLSVCSGQSLCFFADPADRQTEELIAAFHRAFGIGTADRQRRGYGKVINIADRLCAAEGLPPFSVRVLPRAAYVPVGRQDPDRGGDLTGRLRRCCREAESGVLCGVDIGGTDIKLALSVNGQLVCLGEYDWNPAACTTAEELLRPVYEQVDRLRRSAEKLCCPGGELLFDAVGISFPDIVIQNRILGGETPKTGGMRRNMSIDYETAFARISELKSELLALCREGGRVRITNDGSMAAFTAAVELAHSADAARLAGGVLAHSLGTDLGTGWIKADGSIPALPLELYDLILDLGSFRSRAYPPEDLRSTRNENSGLVGARRYMGQAAAYRLAQKLDPSLLEGFTVWDGDRLCIATSPQDLRKPCLEHLMQRAEEGAPPACQIFLGIGANLAVTAREMEYLLHPGVKLCFLFGRFVKRPGVFRLLDEGFRGCVGDRLLIPSDENLAMTPLMQALAERPDVTVAQFGQAVGAIYFALT